jgi:hypothetical protein
MVNPSYFQGRKVVIATKHQKESVIGPALKKAFGLEYIISECLDTDVLGTFSGEIERSIGPLEAAREKCNMGMDICGVDLAISSEGSFGPHPEFFFVPAGEEIMVLKDRKNDLEISAKMLTQDTNYASLSVTSETNLDAFLSHARFPSHGLIVKKSANEHSPIDKGIHEVSRLKKRINEYLKLFGSCYLETDMRAMHNPTRMKAIAELTDRLILKINQCCHLCHSPGFDITDAIRGLPCSLCGMPTRSIKNFIYSCKKCNYAHLEPNPENKKEEDPLFCDFCNP